jgi:hypothetical protein
MYNIDLVTKALHSQHKTVATAESCTGGMIAKLITDIPGASQVFQYGIVSYSNEAKMKLLGVKTMLVGCAGDNCPTARIVQIPVDMVMLTPSVTKWTGGRNKPQLVPTLVSYLKSMRAEVYADGVLNDDQVFLLNRFECEGYVTSATYQGQYPTSRNIGVRTALMQKDTEDDFEI